MRPATRYPKRMAREDANPGEPDDCAWINPEKFRNGLRLHKRLECAWIYLARLLAVPQ